MCSTWYHYFLIMCFQSISLLKLYTSEYMLLKNIPESLRTSWSSSSILDVPIESIFFENTFLGHIALSLYTCCNMYHVSVANVYKCWQNMIFAHSFSNAISVFNECKWLQFTNTVWKTVFLWTYIFTTSCITCVFMSC